MLIDTAGRYTTQDSDAAVGRAGWVAFLDLLRRTRPRQPINGVIVAIALEDLLSAAEAERDGARRASARAPAGAREHASGVRCRSMLLFTKADLVAGFTEFFDDLDRERRDQVWGVTFPLDKARRRPPWSSSRPSSRLLVERLQRAPARAPAGGAESRARARLIAGFPPQIATLDAAAAGLPRRRLRRSRLDPAPLLRGVYFTSGTQEGTPIDRLIGALARTFGLDSAAPPPCGRTGPQLLPRTTDRRGDPGRGDAGERPPGARAPARHPAGGFVRRDCVGGPRAAGWLVFNR